MPAATDLTAESIAVAAQNPASASVDGQSASAVSVSDQIKALEFLQAQQAAASTTGRSGWTMLRPAVVKPPGAQ